MLAMIACDQADYAAAQPFAAEALRLARTRRDAWNEGWALATVGRAALGRGATRGRQGRPGSRTVRGAPASGAMPISLGSILNALGELETASGQPQQGTGMARQQSRGAV